MAIFHDLDERNHYMPLLAPADIAATATNTGYVDMANYNQVTWIVSCGVADTVGAITMEQNTTDDTTAGTEAGLGFKYRVSAAAVTGDSMGAITSVASTASLATLATDDACIYIVEPDQLTDGYRWARLVFTPSGTASATIVGVMAIGHGARYPQNIQLSAT
jgi:hypothetical protein